MHHDYQGSGQHWVGQLVYDKRALAVHNDYV